MCEREYYNREPVYILLNGNIMLLVAENGQGWVDSGAFDWMNILSSDGGD